MKLEDLQKILAAKGHYTGRIDGINGRLTRKAVDLFLSPVVGEKLENWSDARRMVAAEQLHYLNENIPVGPVDGLAGPQTQYAREVYNAKRRGEEHAVTGWRDAKLEEPADGKTVQGPAASQWPTQNSVPVFYGAQNANQVLLEMPFPLRIAWEPSEIVYRVSCHRKVHDALKRIWSQTLDHYGIDGIKKLRLDMYGGCLNPRPMRGSSKPSMHSWGIAWDIDPERNQYKWGRNLASLDEVDYEPFWRIVEGQGAISLGRLRNFDWMHFQFARLS